MSAGSSTDLPLFNGTTGEAYHKFKRKLARYNAGQTERQQRALPTYTRISLAFEEDTAAYAWLSVPTDVLALCRSRGSSPTAAQVEDVRERACSGLVRDLPRRMQDYVVAALLLFPNSASEIYAEEDITADLPAADGVLVAGQQQQQQQQQNQSTNDTANSFRTAMTTESLSPRHHQATLRVYTTAARFLWQEADAAFGKRHHADAALYDKLAMTAADTPNTFLHRFARAAAVKGGLTSEALAWAYYGHLSTWNGRCTDYIDNMMPNLIALKGPHNVTAEDIEALATKWYDSHLAKTSNKLQRHNSSIKVDLTGLSAAQLRQVRKDLDRLEGRASSNVAAAAVQAATPASLPAARAPYAAVPPPIDAAFDPTQLQGWAAATKAREQGQRTVDGGLPGISRNNRWVHYCDPLVGGCNRNGHGITTCRRAQPTAQPDPLDAVLRAPRDPRPAAAVATDDHPKAAFVDPPDNAREEDPPPVAFVPGAAGMAATDTWYTPSAFAATSFIDENYAAIAPQKALASKAPDAATRKFCRSLPAGCTVNLPAQLVASWIPSAPAAPAVAALAFDPTEFRLRAKHLDILDAVSIGIESERLVPARFLVDPGSSIVVLNSTFVQRMGWSTSPPKHTIAGVGGTVTEHLELDANVVSFSIPALDLAFDTNTLAEELGVGRMAVYVSDLGPLGDGLLPRFLVARMGAYRHPVRPALVCQPSLWDGEDGGTVVELPLHAYTASDRPSFVQGRGQSAPLPLSGPQQA